MAFLAALFEGAMVRIEVAIAAVRELHVFESRRAARRVRLVALLAGNLCVQSGQRIARFGMVELLRVLPIVHVVTACAILPELPFVNVFVTALALRRQTQVSLGKIGPLDQRAEVRGDMGGRVALLTSNCGVLSFQGVTCEAMIELLRWMLPVNELEIHPVVLEVAAYAIFAVGVFHLELRVIAPLFRQQLRDFLVAVQTFEGGRAGTEFVAARTLRRSAQRLVRCRKRPRGNLRICGNGGEQQERNQRKTHNGRKFRLPNKEPSEQKDAPRRQAWQVHELGSHSGAVRPARLGWDESNMRPQLLHGADCCPCSVCYRRFSIGAWLPPLRRFRNSAIRPASNRPFDFSSHAALSVANLSLDSPKPSKLALTVRRV